MYEALEDNFLSVDTWASYHWADDARFYNALDKIVRQPGFSEIKMGEYIKRRYVEQFGNREDEAQRITNHYVDLASVVVRYLEAIGQLRR